MRLWTNTLLRLLAGTYFVLTSLYCLLAFLPYTFFFLIKAPAYAWMPWFVRHQAALYWVAAVSALIASSDVVDAWRKKNRGFLLAAACLSLVGIYVTLRPFLASLESNRAAYWWSMAALLPLAVTSLSRWTEPVRQKTGPAPGLMFPYSGAVLTAIIVCAIYLAGAKMRMASQLHTLTFHAPDALYAAWSLISHVVVALAVVFVINLVCMLTARTSKPYALRLVANGGLIFAATWFVLFHFLDSALSFSGWAAFLYSGSLAFTLTLWGFSLVLPFLESSQRGESPSTVHLATWAVLLGSCALAVVFPYLVRDADWSGFLEGTVTLLLWTIVSVCIFRLRPMRAQYSAVLLVCIVGLSLVVYKGLQATEIFWSRPLGSTDDEISLNLQAYGAQDNSFHLVYQILGNSRHEVCGDLCRILRENTNIRDVHATTDVRLVDSLTRTQSGRPNIFVFVIDSMRPDYLGAYNPRVDYTPNLDEFARDSVVMHNVYSQYAGTSLSEPAIWSGAMQLHAHYPQPYSRLNSLDRMLHSDDYQMLVSVDEVLSAILPANDDIVRLDTDTKLWNSLELGTTLKQAEGILDARKNHDQPVFLYTQPKNVHQFAHNGVPSPTSQHWPDRPGLNTRITYEVHWVDSCLGQFFDYLKQRGMYDDSVIIVTSDHGDATGELGRTSHSTSIWPEIMRVPLIVHLPAAMRQRLVYDDTRPSTLTDLAPTLFYLLGHKPIRENLLYGRPLFADSRQELDQYPARDLLLASDVRAVYGILTADGRYFYTTYDSPPESYLFDLTGDPNAEHSILTAPLKQHYDEEIIEHLQTLGDYYGYKPGVGSLLASTTH